MVKSLNKKIKILFLITGLNAGGAEIMLYKLIQKINRQKFTPVVVSLLPKGIVGEKIEKEGVKVYSLDMCSKLDISVAWKLYRLLKQINPDVLHTHLFHANFLGRVIGPYAHIPVIISTIHSINFGGGLRETVLRLTNQCADQTTTISRIVGQSLLGRRIVSPARLNIVYNGIDIKKAGGKLSFTDAETLRRELQIQPETPFIFSAGRLQEQKAYPYLINAALLLKQRKIDYAILIAGDGEMRSQLEGQVKQLGLEDRIVFLGFREDIPQLIALADVFVLSSLWEGLPVVILEAMAAGLPVVSADVGGVAELVVDGETGYLVPPGDPRALADALEKVLSLPAGKKAALGRAGRKRVEENFTLEQMVAAYEQLYLDWYARRKITRI